MADIALQAHGFAIYGDMLAVMAAEAPWRIFMPQVVSVSYTHLTLPTN
jgi:hypothetical protein